MIDKIGAFRKLRLDLSETLEEAEYAEEHWHNKVRWYTKKTAQTATAWASPLDGNLANVWRVISGAATWGVDGTHDPATPPSDEAYLFGTADTLTELGTLVYGDADKILVTANSSATLYLIRIIWGTGTMAAAIAAKQYAEFPYLRAVADNVRKIQDFKMPKVPVAGYKLWAQCANANDNATLDFVLGVHGYDF